MKTRESSMPDASLWESFFIPHEVLTRLGLRPSHRSVVDVGCGYGTFSMAAAEITSGVIHALDIDAQMVAATYARAQATGVKNVVAKVQDFITDGSGLPDESADYLMLFNILHAEDPVAMLREARRTLLPGGLLAIMHWNYDPSTPRGPSLAIRPKPAACLHWANDAGFNVDAVPTVDLPPYHWGLVLRR